MFFCLPESPVATFFCLPVAPTHIILTFQARVGKLADSNMALRSQPLCICSRIVPVIAGAIWHRYRLFES
jgi:hypothetical protein